MPSVASGTRARPIYGRAKRAKRGLLRALGRWSRHDYDVEVVYEHDQPAYKKITFTSRHQARMVGGNLAAFGPTPHLPVLRALRDRAVWVDFVSGRPCDRVDDGLLTALAECLVQIACRRSRPHPADHFRQRHFADLDWLRGQRVIDRHLARELGRRAQAACPPALRIGFDYVDPIGPNLVRRDGCGSVCAIDVKNLHRDTLVGEGLAKISDRWLGRERRAYVFEQFSRLGLADIEAAFEFIRLYERAARVRCKVERDLAVHGRVRKHRAKRHKLTAPLE